MEWFMLFARTVWEQERKSTVNLRERAKNATVTGEYGRLGLTMILGFAIAKTAQSAGLTKSARIPQFPAKDGFAWDASTNTSKNQHEKEGQPRRTRTRARTQAGGAQASESLVRALPGSLERA